MITSLLCQGLEIEQENLSTDYNIDELDVMIF